MDFINSFYQAYWKSQIECIEKKPRNNCILPHCIITFFVVGGGTQLWEKRGYLSFGVFCTCMLTTISWVGWSTRMIRARFFSPIPNKQPTSTTDMVINHYMHRCVGCVKEKSVKLMLSSYFLKQFLSPANSSVDESFHWHTTIHFFLSQSLIDKKYVLFHFI